jgi:hypothetical protein
MPTFQIPKTEYLQTWEFEYLLNVAMTKNNCFTTPIGALDFYRQMTANNRKDQVKIKAAIKILSDTLEKIPMGYCSIQEWLYYVSKIVR